MVAFPSIAELERAVGGRPVVPREGIIAAVALCLRERDGATELVLARRAERDGDPWSGHMSLPGGRVEQGDADLLATARRETLEEVAFDPLAEGRLLGALPVLPGRTRQVLVAPFAFAITSDVEPCASLEHTAAWWARFADLEERTVAVRELPFAVPAFVARGADGHEAVVWGMTHRLLIEARGLVDR